MAKTSTKISTIKTRVDAIAKLDLDNILFGALKGQRTEFADDIDHIISTLELVNRSKLMQVKMLGLNYSLVLAVM